MTKECECAAHSAAECVCGAWDEPSQRTWVGLTDDEIEMTWLKHHDAEGYLRNPNQEGWAYEKELIAKLKEKNT